MSTLAAPIHCGQPMQIVQARMKCLVCGYETKTPGEEGLGYAHPVHCGQRMVVLRELRCGMCGFEMTDTVELQVPAEKPATPTRPRRRQVSLEPATVTDLVGKTWGRFRIVALLGHGGMAVVYKAYQPSLERFVAIKFLLLQGPDPAMVKRFRQEAKLIASLRHPNIVTVLDFGEKQGIAYFVMEYVEGQSLKERLGRPMALEQTLKITGQVGRALQYAHEHGIVHRDVKPSNILLARDDWALLSDFGIAKVLESPIHLTQSGAFVGTPEYMSPEQGRGMPVDARCDIYALGVVLFEMLTGRPPFSGDTPMTVLLKHISEPLPLPRSLNPSIPEEVQQAIVKATAKEPGERYASAGEMVAALGGGRIAEQAISPIAPTLLEEKPDQEAQEADKPPGEKRRPWFWPF